MTDAVRVSAPMGKAFAALRKYSGMLLSWLLCAVLISALLFIYTGNPIDVYTVFSAAASAGLIRLFDFLRTKKLGGLIYAGLFIIVGMVSPMFVGSSFSNAAAFIRWFFSGAQAEETRISFMLTLTLFMVFFLTSACYYFTRVIYRVSMLALVSLIPFALAVKTAAVLPAAYAMIAASLNLIFVIIDGRKNLLKGSAAGGSAAVVYTDFAIAALLLALIIPKPSETPFYDSFEAAISRFSFGGSGETVYRGEYKPESGSTDDLIRGESVLIYVVSTADPVYMKSQVFDVYDPQTGNWTSLGEGVSGSRNWQEKAGLLSYEKLEAALETVLEKEPDFFEDYPFAAALTGAAERESFSIVYSREYAAQYVLAPLRTTKADLSGVRGVTWNARSKAGEIFTNLDRALMPPNTNYTVQYYTENIQDELISSGFCNTDFEEYGDMLENAYFASENDSEAEQVLVEFVREHNSAGDYREDTQTEVSAEIQSLADKITEGLEYDYQKAKAIEQYFLTGGFVYNIFYEPPEDLDTPEYFLFESRTGICSDFARAYTLLARAAGLTVRYTEGFVPRPAEDAPGLYNIFTDNAHAYPEVYIPGAGWVIYEPTPPNLMENGGEGDGRNGGIDYAAMLLTAAVLVCGIGVFILLVLIAPKITERIFRIKVRYIGGEKAVIMLYNRHIKNAEARTGVSLKAFTPEQTAEITERKTGLSLEPLIKPFTEACYGGGRIDKNAFEKAYECYIAQAKAMRGKKCKRRDNV